MFFLEKVSVSNCAPVSHVGHSGKTCMYGIPVWHTGMAYRYAIQVGRKHNAYTSGICNAHALVLIETECLREREGGREGEGGRERERERQRARTRESARDRERE